MWGTWVIIDSCNGLSRVQHCTNATNADLLSFGPLGTNFSKIFIKMQNISSKIMDLTVCLHNVSHLFFKHRCISDTSGALPLYCQYVVSYGMKPATLMWPHWWYTLGPPRISRNWAKIGHVTLVAITSIIILVQWNWSHCNLFENWF